MVLQKRAKNVVHLRFTAENSMKIGFCTRSQHKYEEILEMVFQCSLYIRAITLCDSHNSKIEQL